MTDQINAEVAAAARQQGALVNIADDPEASDFHLPAILQRGALTVAVSSGGGSPAFAALAARSARRANSVPSGKASVQLLPRYGKSD